MQEAYAAGVTQELERPVAGAASTQSLFVPLTEQLANVRRWNEDLEWGFSEADFDAIDLTESHHSQPLVADVIVPYLDDIYLGDDEDFMDGVRHTCDELWSLAAAQQAYAWCFDWLWAEYDGRRKPVRLLPGIEHRPGIRRVAVDLGAHWRPSRHIRPGQIRGVNSAHAEVLAAAAHFPQWAAAMDGKRVPFVWISGYQVTWPPQPESVQSRLLSLAFVRYRHSLSLTVDWAEHSHQGFASPVVLP
ncbi:MAG: hypothetical protein H0W01_01820 [Pseudonocardiales bacterium]|nr:hypothetical protein [Pseudonocardiales bacterium]